MGLLLTIITRVYKRPKMLRVLEESLENQTERGFDHVMLFDEIGVGVSKANVKLRDVGALGEYVLVLDDDDMIQDRDFVKKLKAVAKSKPDVIILKWQRYEGKVLPDAMPLQKCHCGTSNVVVTNAMWMKHRKAWGECYAGDWDYIESLMSDNPTTVELEGIPIKTQKISRGEREA